MSLKTGEPLVAIAPGAGDLPKLTLVAPDGARAEIYLYGAHVTSWAPAGGRERLFMSRKSAFRAGSPIRGGIPVVFPQFGGGGPLPLHGLVRLMSWEFVSADVVGKGATATLRVRDTEESRRQWPFSFQAELSITIGGDQFEVTLAVTNTGAETFAFTSSFHTYLAIENLASTCVTGLEDLRYRDAAAGGIEVQETSPQVDFTGEVNRIYFDAPVEARMIEAGRTTIIRKAGFNDTVVWNPAAAKCAAMADLEPDDFKRFICVEAAIVGAPAHLAPGIRWEGTQTIVA